VAPPLVLQQRHRRLVSLASVDLDRDVVTGHRATVQAPDEGYP
jgi:hypothetical protein